MTYYTFNSLSFRKQNRKWAIVITFSPKWSISSPSTLVLVMPTQPSGSGWSTLIGTPMPGTRLHNKIYCPKVYKVNLFIKKLSYIGHPDVLSHIAIAENECRARVQVRFQVFVSILINLCSSTC